VLALLLFARLPASRRPLPARGTTRKPAIVQVQD
jgi:hypothetical protein